MFVNGEQAASWSRLPAAAAGAARTPFEFALSNSWVKIGVKAKGIYIVTYNDLLSAGANPALIDPATLRLFSGGPYPEPDSLSQEGGSWRDDYHFTEHAILYRGQGVGSLQPTDTVFFYGLPAAGWANDADPSASPRAYIKHPYDSTNVYWLTWGGGFAGAPRRVAERDVAPLYSPSDTLITWYEERMRSEKDLYYDPIYVDDRWYWNFLKMKGSTSYFQDEFSTSDVADASGVMKTKAYGPYNSARYNNPNTATYLINGAVCGTLTWLVLPDYRPSSMKILEAAVSNIAEGRNVFGVSKPVDHEMYIFWYEIFYHQIVQGRSGGAPFRRARAGTPGALRARGIPGGGEAAFRRDLRRNPCPLHGMAAGVGRSRLRGFAAGAAAPIRGGVEDGVQEGRPFLRERAVAEGRERLPGHGDPVPRGFSRRGRSR